MERNLVENNTMYLGSVYIKELPEGFSTSLSLDLSDSMLEALPNGLTVGGDLIIGNANIKALPQELKIGGNLIMLNRQLSLPDDIVIGKSIITKNGIEESPFQQNNMIITDDGKRVSFKQRKKCYNGYELINDYYYPEVYYYYGINKTNSAIEFSENGNTYIFSCETPRKGFYKIDWQRALNAGVEKYKDYNVDELRSVAELKEIYQVCTGACESGIQKFKEILHIDDNKLYSIRDLANMIIDQHWVKGASIIFFDFFDLENPNLIKGEVD